MRGFLAYEARTNHFIPTLFMSHHSCFCSHKQMLILGDISGFSL